MAEFSIVAGRKRLRTLLGTAGCIALIVGSGACGANDPQGSLPASSEIAEFSSELTIGSTGPAVVELHEYFSRYGYFSNSALQKQFPAWRPIVASAPADNATFDSATEAAVRAFQRNSGIKVTGVVDEATRMALQQSRCDVPDGIEHHNQGEKWDLSNSGTWDHTNLTWKLINTYSGSSDPAVQAAARAQVEGAIAAALAQWDTRSGYTFTKTSGTADITVTFASLPANVNAGAAPISGGGDITMNIDRNWSIGVVPVQSDAMDMQSILVHELGHSIGLAHTTFSTAIMYPFFSFGQTPKNDPTVDDTTSVLAMQSAFTLFDSSDVDIAYNRQANGNEQIWVTGGGTTTGGYNIWDLRNKSTWTNHPGGAVRIAVNPSLANAEPWIVNDSNELFKYNNGTGGWDIVSSECATDVGVGSDSTVWVVGCNSVGGGHDIKKLTGTRIGSSGPYVCSGSCFSTVGGGAVRIAVGPKGQAAGDITTIVPWVTNNANEIFRGSNATLSLSFEMLPGSGTDIAAADGVAWSIGSNGSIQVWDDQNNDGSPPPVGGGPPPVTQHKWVTVPGFGTNISVSAGRPLVVNSAGNAHWTEPN